MKATSLAERKNAALARRRARPSYLFVDVLITVLQPYADDEHCLVAGFIAGSTADGSVSILDAYDTVGHFVSRLREWSPITPVAWNQKPLRSIRVVQQNALERLVVFGNDD